MGWGKIKGEQIPAEIAPKQIWLKRSLWVAVLPFPRALGAGSCQLRAPWLVSPGVELQGPASTGQREGDETQAGLWVSLGSPGASLTAVHGSAPQKALKEMFPIESGDINMENRIIPHLPGEGQVPGLK